MMTTIMVITTITTTPIVMMHRGLISLLHISDPTLPIGGYSHSYGLESYVQRGELCDELSAKRFVVNTLNENLLYNDAIYLRLAWQAYKDGDFERLAAFDMECTATKTASEIRSASLKLGVRLLKIFARHLSAESVAELERLTKRGGGHYSIMYGAIAAVLGLELFDAVLSFYYNSMVCMVTNAVKLIPLGQLSGQDIIFEVEAELEALTQRTIDMDESMRGVCAVGFDIACMEHERLYSRLYMS